ncbi:MAG: HupE/UreJ family protein [Bacteroidia bacterium]
MQDFTLWLSIGFNHILDWQGYDHILFVTVLCAAYSFTEWKKVLILVTAFTIGHSLTLALSVLDVLKIPSAIIEFLIPVTIVITALTNIITRNKPAQKTNPIYFLALFFGFIHGMGFSYLLKSLLGKEQSVIMPLFSFNLGLELGQMLIVAVVLLISLFLTSFLKVKKNNLNFFVSSVIIGIAFIMAIQRLFVLIN